MPAVAVTDHGNLFAAEQFYRQAVTRGVRPIIGCEVYVAKGSRHDRGEASQREGAVTMAGIRSRPLSRDPACARPAAVATARGTHAD